MDNFKVTLDNLPHAVESTLRLCKSQLQDEAQYSKLHHLARSLQVAVESLQLIESEIHGETVTTKRLSLGRLYTVCD